MKFLNQRQHKLPKNAFLMAEQIAAAQDAGDDVRESVLVKRFSKRYGDMDKYKVRVRKYSSNLCDIFTAHHGHSNLRLSGYTMRD